ncbi:MFS transporter [Aurantimonas endophytica]|uniref:Sugar phosphate permease n=1 Tax=Aurantimonas endophytica TaxID=1522175 RepID=A0A7W6MMY3_9HYPH|nr:sugar phosphate permease [Aurantimonas endophytica]MCO6403077.1 MFS transporter [Aurantimonas endophytica]
MSAIVVLAVTYVLSQFFRSFLAVLAPVLTTDLGVGEAALATASGVWFIAFALMQFPVGWSLDRYGPRRTTSLLLLAAVAGALLFALAEGPAAIIAAMALIGIGCSAVLMAAFYLLARQFPPQRFAMFASWIVASGLSGGVLGSAPLALATEAFGWRVVMAGLAGVTLVAALAVAALVRDPPAASAPQGSGSLFTLLKMRQLWPLMAIAFVAYAPAANLRGLWAGPFLADVHGYDIEAIGRATLVMAIALILGTIIYGPLDVLFNTRKRVPFVGVTVTGLCLALLAATSGGSATIAVVLMTAVTFFGAGYALIMAHARAMVPAHLIGRGVTLMNFFSIGGAGVIQFLSGTVFATAAGRTSPESAYAVLFGFYALLLAAGLTAYSFSRDMRTR